jgi:predicted DNA-binding protein
MKDKTITIRASAKFIERLNGYSKSKGVSVSQIIRKSVEDRIWLEEFMEEGEA